MSWVQDVGMVTRNERILGCWNEYMKMEKEQDVGMGTENGRVTGFWYKYRKMK